MVNHRVVDLSEEAAAISPKLSRFSPKKKKRHIPRACERVPEDPRRSRENTQDSREVCEEVSSRLPHRQHQYNTETRSGTPQATPKKNSLRNRGTPPIVLICARFTGHGALRGLFFALVGIKTARGATPSRQDIRSQSAAKKGAAPFVAPVGPHTSEVPSPDVIRLGYVVSLM